MLLPDGLQVPRQGPMLIFPVVVEIVSVWPCIQDLHSVLLRNVVLAQPAARSRRSQIASAQVLSSAVCHHRVRSLLLALFALNLGSPCAVSTLWCWLQPARGATNSMGSSMEEDGFVIVNPPSPSSSGHQPMYVFILTHILTHMTPYIEPHMLILNPCKATPIIIDP